MVNVGSELDFYKPQPNRDFLLHYNMGLTVHPELPEYVKVNYSVYVDEDEGISSEMYIHYYNRNRVLIEHFAQILKRNHDEDKYILACRSGIIRPQHYPPFLQKFSNYPSTLRRYNVLLKNVKDSEVCHQYAVNNMSFRSQFHVDHVQKNTFNHENHNNQLRQEEGAESSSPFYEEYRYENLNDETKYFVQLFVPDDFSGSETMKVMRNDLSKTVVGYPTADAIDLASDILRKIEIILDGKEREYVWRRDDLSNLFHAIIPCCSGVNGEIPLIDSVYKVREKLQLLQALRSRSFREKLIPQSKPQNELLFSLQFPLITLDQGTGFGQHISNCISNGNSRSVLEVRNIFGYDTNATVPLGEGSNKYLLWHGTNISNVCSILRNGFDRSRAQISGIFGNGIYFSDAWAKAQGYLRGERGSSDAVLFLCEVELGKIYESRSGVGNRGLRYSVAGAPHGFDSVKGVGQIQPDQNAFVVDDFGGKFFTAMEDNRFGRYMYNEYVVYRESQIKIRYVVHVVMASSYNP